MTFAISDPDGAITSTLLKGRAALFGKEVTIQRWVDKPLLVQCSRCDERSLSRVDTLLTNHFPRHVTVTT